MKVGDLVYIRDERHGPPGIVLELFWESAVVFFAEKNFQHAYTILLEDLEKV